MIIGSRNFDFNGQHAYVMGILNVTPDSFSDGGKFLDPERALDQALKMQEEGADILDIGAESTRPGARPVSEEEEKSRLLPVLKKIAPRLKIPLSIDTQKPAVADAALSEGGVMINDISALEQKRLAEVVARHCVPVVLMHKRGVPETMQDNPAYKNVVQEVCEFLEERMERAVEQGISKEKILIDPGFGFGKRFEDNLNLLKNLESFRSLEAPLLVGVSRKSFLRNIFGEDEKSLLAGNAAAVVLAVRSGVSLVRVHDVAISKAAIRLALGA